jgi:trk system potassium uptake protein
LPVILFILRIVKLNIVIVGSTSIGVSLAKELAEEGHEVTIISEDQDKLHSLQNSLDIRTVYGKPSYPDVLKIANTEDADIFIAVTDSDEKNMIACQVAYSLFKVPLKIAKIRSSHYFVRNELFSDQNLPIDVFINPEQLIAKHVYDLVNNPGVSGIYSFVNNNINLIIIRVTKETKFIAQHVDDLKNIEIDLPYNLVAVMRNGKYLNLASNPMLFKGDEVLMLVSSANTDCLVSSLYKNNRVDVSKVIIVGGGGVGAATAEYLDGEGIQVKIIEHNKHTCESLAKKFDNITILEGDASDRSLLLDENVENVDFFCALTSDDEDNIISSLQAKYLGAKNTLALINNNEYKDLFGKSDIDVLFFPQQSSISEILTAIRHRDITNVYSILCETSQCIEISLSKFNPSDYVGKYLAHINIPKVFIFGAIGRGNNVVFDENTMLEENDILILLIPNKKDFSQIYNILN